MKLFKELEFDIQDGREAAQGQAAVCLLDMAENAISAARLLLLHGDDGQQQRAARALLRMWQDSDDAAADLLVAGEEGSLWVALEVVRTLKAFDSDYSQSSIRDKAISGLESTSASDRLAAVRILQEHEYLAPPVSLLSGALLKDADDRVREAAARALGSDGIDHERNPEGMNALARAAACDHDDDVRAAAVDALGRISSCSDAGVSALCQILVNFDGESAELRGRAAASLVKIGGSAIRAMELALREANPE